MFRIKYYKKLNCKRADILNNNNDYKQILNIMDIEILPEEIFVMVEEHIDMTEDIILNDKVYSINKNYMLNCNISLEYYDMAKEGYKEMIKEETLVTTYMNFAYNAGGMQCYGFYKAKNGKVYIIDSFINNIRGIFIPDKNIDCLRDVIV